MATVHAPVVSSRAFRFDLKSLLIAIAAVAIVLAPVRLFGVLYLISAASSVALVGVCCHAYSSRSRGRAVGMAFLGLIVGVPLGMLAFAGHAFINLLVCAMLAALHVRPKTFAFTVIGLTVFVYGWAIWNGMEEVRTLEILRDKYRFKSFAKRLAFERSPRNSAARQIAPIQMTPAVATHLDELEDNQAYDYGRPRALRRLHEDTTTQFALAAGFGPARMPMLPNSRHIELPTREKFIPPMRLDISSAKPSASELYPVHRNAVFDFVDPDRMGYVRSRDVAAGFESHGLSSIADPCAHTLQDVARWQVTRLELISLLRHDEPRVYVAESLPQMDELAETPHRALNEFEATALPQLDTAKDVVIDQQPKRIQMLGAVRAANKCLECHEGQRGKLLGAFSYEIVPIVDTTQAAR